MKRLVWSLLLAIFAFTAGACTAEAKNFVKSARYAADYAPGEALVVLKNQIGSLSAQSLAGAAGKNYVTSVAALAAAEALHTYDALSVASGEIFVLMKSATKSTENLIAELKKNPNVVSASPNYRIHAFANEPNDPYYRDGRLWGLKKIRVDEVWETTTGGSGVHVAVVDSGVLYTHEDLAGNVNRELSRNFVNPNPEDSTPVEDGNFLDGNGHGTHVAGTVAAVGDNNKGVAGVNWEAKIISLKVLGDDGSGWTSWSVAAVNYLVRLLNGNPDLHVPAANFSLGSWQREDPEVVKSDVEWRAFKALDDLNRTVIAVAAGNEAHEVGAPAPNTIVELDILGGGYVYPASFTGLNNMIVVGALDQDDTAAYFSNWSSESVHLTAPGVSIWSTYLGNGYESNDGTSMAAPHVAGAVALVASVNSNLNAGQLKSLLCDNANARVNPQQLLRGAPEPQRVRDRTLSKYGLLDVKAALDAAQSTEPPVYVEEITVTPDLLALTVGGTQALSVTVLPDNASDKRVSWTSDAPSVAEVDSAGQVTGKSVGETFITVRALGAEGDLSARVDVSVTAGSGPGPNPDPEPAPDPDPEPEPDPDPVPTPDPNDPRPINRAPDVNARLDEINATLLGVGSGVNFVGSKNLANYAPLQVQGGEVVVTYIGEARFSLHDAPVLSGGYATTTAQAPLIEVDVSEVSGAGGAALVPIRAQFSLSRGEMDDIFGQDLALALLSNPVQNASSLFDKLSIRSENSGAFSTLIPARISPAIALNMGLLNLTGGERLSITFYLLAADTGGTPRLDKTQLIVPDGTQDGVAQSLVWLVRPVSVPPTKSSGGGGCNAFSGALASLLALAALLGKRRQKQRLK